ncbi:hypothetical protein CROQUDRAFT_101531 [Cronartium quercuum f. sp. fusiforme G11]|uniref:Sm protein B n=1 Tax=Cronartium quercuum f. sp. fusiforme G11 TaxID=708437 RepID=A0A9P6N850_9BASI|nr:hypothetical protein CROQUDRAFT_101531 [Cronartium quercuum f. sp. fusiforme G11]
MLALINYRLRVTLNDSRTLTGQMLAFDRHLNLVLADCEEFRFIKQKKRKGLNPATTPDESEELEMKRALGLVILRGETIVSLSVEGPPPVVADEKGPVLAPGRGTGLAAGRGVGLAPPPGVPPPMMRGQPMPFSRPGGPPGIPPGLGMPPPGFNPSGGSFMGAPPPGFGAQGQGPPPGFPSGQPYQAPPGFNPPR